MKGFMTERTVAEESRITQLAATDELVTWDRYERNLLADLERRIELGGDTKALAIVSQAPARQRHGRRRPSGTPRGGEGRMSRWTPIQIAIYLVVPLAATWLYIEGLRRAIP